eukprot:5839126-Alexandrium_andersonii.AAC.1
MAGHGRVPPLLCGSSPLAGAVRVRAMVGAPLVFPTDRLPAGVGCQRHDAGLHRLRRCPHPFCM